MDHTVAIYDTDMCEIQCHLKEHKDRVVGTNFIQFSITLARYWFSFQNDFECFAS